MFQQGVGIENNCLSLAFARILLPCGILMPFLYVNILRYGLPLIYCLKVMLSVITSVICKPLALSSDCKNSEGIALVFLHLPCLILPQCCLRKVCPNTQYFLLVQLVHLKEAQMHMVIWSKEAESLVLLLGLAGS